MIRIIIVSIFCLLNSFSAYSQFSLQVSRVMPSGDFGFVFKPSLGIELEKKVGDIEDQFLLGYSIGFYRLTPRLDTFPLYDFRGGNFVPGYEIWNEYYVIPLGFTTEYALWDKTAHAIAPFVGLDLYYYAVSIDYQFRDAFRDSQTSGGVQTVAIVPKFGGVSILNDHFQLSYGIGYSIAFDEYEDWSSFWKPFFTLTYFR